MPFADLLQFLSANQNTGTLQVRQGHVLKMVFFEKGKIISSSSSDPREYLGHFLVSHGYINEDELRIAMEIQRNSKMLLGKILVMGGKIKEEEMAELLKLKSEETVYSIFLWAEGEFNFYHDEFINRLFIRIALDPQAMIFEGVLRADEWARIREIFPHNNVVLEQVPNANTDLGSFDAFTKKVLEKVDGKNTIDDLVLALHSVDFVVCRSLFHLYEEGFIRIRKMLGAPQERKALGGDYAETQMLDLAKEDFDKGRFEEAVDILRQIDISTDGYQNDVAPLLARAEEETIREIYSVLLPDKVVELLIPLNQVAHAGLTPEEGFLLSRIDGTWTLRNILTVTPIKEIDALRLMKKLLERGIIGLR
jgi:hypothetical protein